jgi:Cd2+/Zn2+-exporting ATPase
MSTTDVDLPVSLVPGDNCGDCALRLGDALLHHRGIVGVAAASPGQLTISYDPELCSLECLTHAAAEIGLELERTFAHENRPVDGMDCYDCATTIQRAVSRLDGVVHCNVNFAAARMRLEYDAARTEVPVTVDKVVTQLGYRLGPPLGRFGSLVSAESVAHGEHDDRAWWRRRSDELITALAAVATIAAVITDALGGASAAKAMYGLAVVIGGFEIARAGARAVLATRRLDINILMTIAVVGAVAIGAWLEAALVVVLFRVGENLEHYAVDRARRSLESLMRLAPETARRRACAADGQLVEDEVPVASLQIGDVVVVRPGERLPADGRVLEGDSSVDQAAITGESMPVDKTAGADVFAGTMNGEGMLVVTVTTAAGDSTLDRVARAVADAQAQRSPAERWVDSFARVYTPAVLVLAALVAVVPPLLFDRSWSDWVYRGLAFLILACPCALVIATPVAVVAALSRASRAGVLVKGGAHLEAATRLRAVATDKTGTLTVGHPFVTDVCPAPGRAGDDVLTLAAAVDTASEHPLARAIVAEARSKGLVPPAVTGFEVVRGFGARGQVDGQTISVGSERMLADHPAFDSIRSAIDDLAARGRTVVIVATEREVVGALGLADTIRPDVIAAMDALRRLGIEHTALLTGDHQGAASAIAAEAGITDVRFDLLPGDKVAALDEVQRAFGPTAMIGDGVNDSPALATASLGIAMGGAGSPTAIETADVILMGDDLRKLPGLLSLAFATRSVVRQNIGFSLTTKAVAAGFALFGMLPLWLAVMADVGATLLVVVNGLRLTHTRLDPPLEVEALTT